MLHWIFKDLWRGNSIQITIWFRSGNNCYVNLFSNFSKTGRRRKKGFSPSLPNQPKITAPIKSLTKSWRDISDVFKIVKRCWNHERDRCVPKTEYQWGINGGIFLLYALTGMAIISCIFFLLKFNMDYDWWQCFSLMYLSQPVIECLTAWLTSV